MKYKQNIMKKLTYYQICSLAAEGRFDEIPSGYNIIWLDEKPEKKFSVCIDGGEITFTRNECPVPLKITVTVEVVPAVPVAPDLDIDETSYMKYGDVFIPTRYQLTELEMFYDESKKDIVDLWRKEMLDNMHIKHIRKDELSFDMVIPTNMFDVKVYGAMLCSLHEENFVAKAELNYDFFELYEKNHSI